MHDNQLIALMSEHFTVADLPSLTEPQSAYVYYRIFGDSPTEAYKKSYDIESKRSDRITAYAHRTENGKAVRKWIERARRAAMFNHVVELSDHCSELVRLREEAVERGQISAAVRAEMARGQVAGLYVERHEHKHTHDIGDRLNEARKRVQQYREHGKPAIDHQPGEKQTEQARALEWEDAGYEVVQVEDEEDSLV
jgi:hypothetical protein